MRTWLIAIVASMLILGAFLADIDAKASQVDAQTANVEKMVDFLGNTQFNQSLGLCREAPNVAPNTYWLVSDNLWSWKALTMANESGLANAAEAGVTAEKIKSSLTALALNYGLPTDSNGLPKSYCHETVIGDHVQPPYKTETSTTLYNDSYILKTDMRNGAVMSDWYNYTDLLLYSALSCHWQGNDSGALAYFNNATKMWNQTSQGIQDKGTNEKYSVYKLALLLYTSKLLGQNLPFEQELVDRIYLQQAENGGIITDYYANGTWVIGADANTETTSIVIIALLTPPPITQTPTLSPSIPPTSTIPLFEITIIVLIVVILLIAVLALKRPFQHFSRRTQRQVFAKFNFAYGFIVGNFSVDKLF
jgi:hypothetical protein